MSLEVEVSAVSEVRHIKVCGLGEEMTFTKWWDSRCEEQTGPVNVNDVEAAWNAAKGNQGRRAEVLAAVIRKLIDIATNGSETKEEFISRVRAILSEPPDGFVDAWQPIETAPHDQRLLIWTGQEMYCANWAKNPYTGDEAWIVAEWGTEGDQALVKPTHWCTPPESPAG